MRYLMIFIFIFLGNLKAENSFYSPKIEEGVERDERVEKSAGENDSSVIISSNLESQVPEENLSPFQPKMNPHGETSTRFRDQVKFPEKTIDLLIFGHPLGGGFGLRGLSRPICCEWDVSLSPLFASSSLNLIISYGSMQTFYTGIGAGVLIGLQTMRNDYHINFPIPYVPISVGYWGKTIFVDFGIDLVPYVLILPVPTFRFGAHF